MKAVLKNWLKDTYEKSIEDLRGDIAPMGKDEFKDKVEFINELGLLLNEEEYTYLMFLEEFKGMD